METIKLSKEDIEFLKELQHELNTQTNDGNADPVYWGVLEKKEIVVPEGYGGDEGIYFSDETENSGKLEDVVAWLDETVDDDIREEWDNDVDKTDIYDVIDFYNDWRGDDMAEIMFTREDDVLSYNTGAFLTKRACKEYIQRYGYNHNQPRTYAMTAYRNFELERLLKILKTMKFEEE